MTSQEIQTYIASGFDDKFTNVYITSALWQIALQLAICNERNALMIERYLEMTAPAVKHRKGKAKK